MDYLARLHQVHPLLIAPIIIGGHKYERERGLLVRVTCGLRDKATQRRLVREGKSQTLKSKHLTGQAVDLAILKQDGSEAIWDYDFYADLNSHIQREVPKGIGVGWGGDWVSLVDAVHWELVGRPFPDRDLLAA